MGIRSDFTRGQQVIFGSPNGQQTRAEIIKLNPVKAQLKILEKRGEGRGSEPGSIWLARYSALRPLDPNAKPGEIPRPAPRPPLVYTPFAHEDNLILEAIVCCHSGLSPENLHCDGEASASHVRHKYAELTRKLKYLQLALGREVDESEAYDWSEKKDAFQKEQQARRERERQKVS